MTMHSYREREFGDGIGRSGGWGSQHDQRRNAHALMGNPDVFYASDSNEAEAVLALNQLFQKALAVGASDVHIRVRDFNTTDVRFRIDGKMVLMAEHEGYIGAIFERKIREKASVSLNDRHLAADGRTALVYGGVGVDLRVNLIPLNGGKGQKICCRLLLQSNATRTLDKVRMTPAVRAAFDQAMAAPDGLLLMTGPTGSGKTSTLYACLNTLPYDEMNVMTAEDPVEYTLDWASQVEISRELSFPMALRAFLRQDPDVILVGEIRDGETACIASQASLTGHLVLSTLHANSAVETITRVIDLGVDPYTVGSVLRAVVAQRLVNKLCPACRDMEAPDEAMAAWLVQHGADPTASYGVRRGCQACDHTGEQGREPVIEMIVKDREIQKAIERTDLAAMAEAARKQVQYESLVEAAIRLAREGHIALERARQLGGNT